MPELNAVPSQTFADVQVGDYLLGMRVEDVKRGTKWVHVTTRTPGPRSQPRTSKWLLGSPAPISRMVPTPEERQAQQAAEAVDALAYLERGDREALASYGARVVRDVQVRRFPAWDALEGLGKMTAAVDAWEFVSRKHRRQTVEALGTEDGAWTWGTGGSADVPDRLAVAEATADSMLDQLLKYGIKLHGSTSPASRLEEDARVVGELEWARQVKSVAVHARK